MPKNFLNIIERRGVKRVWIARKLGIHPANITNWIKGKPIPNKHKAKLARLLRVKKGDLE